MNLTDRTTFKAPFIVIEGLDGSGKTTLAHGISTRLVEHGHDVLLTREPTRSPIGKLLRNNIDGDCQSFSEDVRCLLFAADRSHHLRTQIVPALQSGQTVICDRYVLSTFAYQLSGEGSLSMGRVHDLHGPHVFPDPDLVLFLDLSPELAMERIHSARSIPSGYETLERLRRVRNAYLLELRRRSNFYLMDASASKEEVLDNALDMINVEFSYGL